MLHLNLIPSHIASSRLATLLECIQWQIYLSVRAERWEVGGAVTDTAVYRLQHCIQHIIYSD